MYVFEFTFLLTEDHKCTERVISDDPIPARVIFNDRCERIFGIPKRIIKCEIVDGDYTITVYPRGKEDKDCKIVMYETTRERAECIVEEVGKRYEVELKETPISDIKRKLYADD